MGQGVGQLAGTFINFGRRVLNFTQSLNANGICILRKPFASRRFAGELGETRPERNWPKCVKCKLDKKSCPGHKQQRDMPCGCQEMRQRGKNQEWKMENSKRVAQGYPQGYRTRTSTRTSHDGRVETEAEAEAAESVLEPESEAAFRVHFQMKAATNFKVDYVCRSHLSRIPIPIPPPAPATLAAICAHSCSLSAAACPGAAPCNINP